MVRLILAVVLTISVVSFVMVNTHHVNLSFVVGPPVKIRLIFLLMSAFFVGTICTSFLMMVWRLRGRPRPDRGERSATDA